MSEPAFWIKLPDEMARVMRFLISDNDGRWTPMEEIDAAVFGLDKPDFATCEDGVWSRYYLGREQVRKKLTAMRGLGLLESKSGCSRSKAGLEWKSENP